MQYVSIRVKIYIEGREVRLKPKELIKKLQGEGWEIARIQGSHHIMKHKEKGMVTVPLHNKDLKPGTLNSILKQTGLK